MNPSLHILSASLILAACSTPGSGQEPGKPLPVPRYRLEIGEELQYAFEFPYKNPDGSLLIERTNWTFWVADTAQDGGWRLIARHSRSYAKENEPAPADESPDNQTWLASCRLFPDGRIVPTSRLMWRIDIASVFPRLPADPRQAGTDWDVGDDHNDIKGRSRMKWSADQTEAVIETFTEGPAERVYLGSGKSTTYHFDRARGMMMRAEVESPYAYGQAGKATGTIILKGVERLGSDRVKVLRDEADRGFKAEASYMDLFEKAKHARWGTRKPFPEGPKGAVARFFQANDVRIVTGKRLAEAKEVLVAAQAKTTLPMVRETLDLWIKNHEEQSKSNTAEAVRWAEVIGRPAPDWELKDLEGKSHAMKDYRGKVVLLDFWYRNCVWCMRAMPQVNGVARHFKGKPVALLAMNIDQDPADARYVVDKLGITYPVLRAHEESGERMRTLFSMGFPTLVIIDRDGIVRDAHVGFSDTLGEDVIKAVDALLDERKDREK
ncbi:MAG: TlpA family protein disulfide reductase [Isosphaerales bacterium]